MDTNGRTMEAAIIIEQDASNSLGNPEKEEEEELVVICDGSNPYKKVKLNVAGDSRKKDARNTNDGPENDSEIENAQKGEEGGEGQEKKKKKKKKSKKKEKDDDAEDEGKDKREKKKSEKDGTKKKHKDNEGEKEGKEKEKKKKKKKKENEDDDKEKKKKSKKEDAEKEAKEKERRKKKKKEKALEAYQKKFQEFERKYPKFMQKGKIKFPIDDMLFMLYDTILSEHVPKTKKPVPKDGLIPPSELGDILQVWNFYSSFPELFTFKNIQQEEIYAALYKKYDGQEHIYLNDYFHQEILIFFVKDFIKKNKFETFRDETENPFFVLIKYYAGYENPQSDELSLIWTELLKKLTSIHPYTEFLTDTTKKHVQIVADNTTLHYNKLEYKTKIRVLLELINLSYESETFKDCLQEKMDRATGLSKERNELLTEIKQEEQESYDLKAKIELAEKTLKEEEEKWEHLPRVEVIKRQKDIENDKKELQKTQASLAKLQASFEKKQKRVEEINSSSNLNIETATRLGLDANKSEYWLFAGQPDRLYVKMSPIVYTEDTWRYFDEKEQLDTLLEALNLKGIKERQLSERLKEAISNGSLALKSTKSADETTDIVSKETEQGGLDLNYYFSKAIKYSTPVESVAESAEAGRTTRKRTQEQAIEKIVKKRNRELKHLTLDGVKELIDRTEENLTQYLDMWNARWAHPKIKEDLKKRIKEATNAKELAILLLELEKKFQFSETPLRQKTQEGETNADEGEQQEDYEDRSEEEEEEEEEEEVEAEEEKDEENDEEKRSSDRENFYGEEEDEDFDNRKIKKKSKNKVDREREEEERRKEESEGKSEEDQQRMEVESHLKEDKNKEVKTEDTSKMDEEKQENEKEDKEKQSENKKEDEPQEKVKKLSYNVCGLFLVASIFCEFVDNYVEKKRVKYFSNYKNVAEYIAAKKERKLNAMASRATDKRQHNQQQYLEKLKQDREIRRQNYALNRYAAQHAKYRADSESPDEAPIKKKPGFAKENTEAAKAKSGSTGDAGGKRIRKLKEKSSEQSESEAEYEFKPKQQEEKTHAKQEKLNDLLGVRRSTRLSRRVEISSEPDEEETYEPKNCCICRRSGEVVLCAMCDSGYHLDCVGLKSMPEDKWTCFTCLQKLASQRQTRSTTRKLH